MFTTISIETDVKKVFKAKKLEHQAKIGKEITDGEYLAHLLKRD